MESKDYVKHKRKLIVSPPKVMGFLYSHYFTEIKKWDEVSKKTVQLNEFMISLNLTFFWLGAMVQIHSNSDDIDKSFKAYKDKILIIKRLATEAYSHLTTGKGPFVTRDFLNDSTINDGFGATLFITCNPDSVEEYCVFEISSCYKKYRYGTNPKGMKHYLKSLLEFITEKEMDLKLVEERINSYLGDKNGKQPI